MSDPATALHHARKGLLDLSPRNRLLDSPRHAQRACALEILDARSEQIFQMLAREGGSLGFRPGKARHRGDDPFFDLPPPKETRQGPRSVSADRVPCLQTALAAGTLHGRLLRLYHEARTAYEEHGLLCLFLALGFLEWQEPAPSRHVRRAPLLLLSVRLERAEPGGRFTLAMADDEITANLCLIEKLQQDFALALPVPPEAAGLEPGAYLCAWAETLRSEPQFLVQRDEVELGLFSCARFLMYRDLDPLRWPASTPLVERPLIRALLGDGFGAQAGALPKDAELDELLPPLETVQVLAADSTQAAVIEEVRRGRSLLVQGPPGTGKSQTIANLIAGAVRSGKKVLFVAEKMVALEVVRDRLEQIELGPLCLDLHSQRSGRRSLIADLRQTLELGQPQADDPRPVAREIMDLRRRLTQHARLLHTPVEPAGLTPFELIGHLIRLARRGTPRAEVRLPSAPAWTRAEIAERRIQIDALAVGLGRIGVPAAHV